jgi:ER lumen protein retaining receptor
MMNFFRFFLRVDASTRLTALPDGRLSADLLHLASIVLLLLKIYATKNVKGLSLKTQVLFLVVFCARYLDVFTNWRNPYNVVMKVLFLGLSGLTVYWIGWRYHKASS